MKLNKRGKACAIIAGMLIVLFSIGFAVVSNSELQKTEMLLTQERQRNEQLQVESDRKDAATEEVQNRLNLLQEDYSKLKKEHANCPK